MSVLDCSTNTILSNVKVKHNSATVVSKMIEFSYITYHLPLVITFESVDVPAVDYILYFYHETNYSRG